jgi:hypothetical protein
VTAALAAANLTAGAVCMRYPAQTYRLGAFTHPQASVRAQAVALTVAGCRWAQALGAAELVIWPQVKSRVVPLRADSCVRPNTRPHRLKPSRPNAFYTTPKPIGVRGLKIKGLVTIAQEVEARASEVYRQEQMLLRRIISLSPPLLRFTSAPAGVWYV